MVDIIICVVLKLMNPQHLKNWFAKCRYCTSRATENAVLVKLGIDKANREAISTIFSYGISTLGIIVIFQTQGFNVSSLAVLARGLGVGIGLGFENITKNFISGLNLLIDLGVKKI